MMSFIPLALVLALCSKDKPRDEPVKVTLSFENGSIAEILMEFERQTGIPVEMDEAARAGLHPSKRVWFKVREMAPVGALHLLFRPYCLTVRCEKKRVLITVDY